MYLSHSLIRILLVEDNPADYHMIRKFLLDAAPAQYNLDYHYNKRGALEWLERTPCDLLLLDLNLPDSEGLCTLRAFKAQFHGAITVLTGSYDEQMGLQAVQEGAQDYLVKDQVSAVLLWKTLRYSLERHNYQQLMLEARKREQRANQEGRLYQQRAQEERASRRALEVEIAERKRIEEKLQHMVLHDDLTKLPNRRQLESYYHQIASDRRYKHQTVCLLYIDINRFKLVNDTQGHIVGDSVLIAFAKELKKIARRDDLVSRLSGDDFAVLLVDIDEEHALNIAQRIQALCEEPLYVEGHQFYLGVSIGIVTATCGEFGIVELMRRADLAMYHAKDQATGYHIYDDVGDQNIHFANSIEQGLREALKHNQLFLEYQPIFTLNEGTACKAEALLRWEHPDKGKLAPGTFLDIAELSGMIHEIDTWVVDNAIQAAKQGNFSVCINLSANAFKTDAIINHIAYCLKHHDLSPQQLCVELTEQVLAHPQETLHRVEALHELGVLIAVDDFGTGYSSLAYLRQYPFDILKIDKSFMHAFGSDPKVVAIVEIVIELAHRLGVQAVVEGIETQEQHQWVKETGCEYAQGFLFDTPLPLNTLLERYSQL